MPSSATVQKDQEAAALEEILYLASPTGDIPRPIALFGVTPNRAQQLHQSFSNQFARIGGVLGKNRDRELEALRSEYSFRSAPLVEERNRLFDKYQDLIWTYRDRPDVTHELAAWRKDALGPINARITSVEASIENMPTPLRVRLDRFELAHVILSELRAVRKRLREINEEYGLQDDPYYLEYGLPSEVRKELDECVNLNLKALTAPYVFMSDLDGFDDSDLSLEFVLENFGKNSLGLFRWGILAFEPSHNYWAAKANPRIKELVYSGFRLIEDGLDLSPIENRLKEELESRCIAFHFQHPFKGYVLDFLIERDGKRINVECDGRDYHSSAEAVNHDRIRNNVMASNGIFVLRFSGSEIWKDVSRCVDLIEDALNSTAT